MKEYQEKPEGWIEDKAKAEDMAMAGNSLRSMAAENRFLASHGVGAERRMKLAEVLDPVADKREETAETVYDIVQKAKELDGIELDDLIRTLQQIRNPRLYESKKE